jgi:hypothetical protein
VCVCKRIFFGEDGTIQKYYLVFLHIVTHDIGVTLVTYNICVTNINVMCPRSSNVSYNSIKSVEGVGWGKKGFQVLW